ncbi:uncharacterized protein LOC124493623 [Dermatophagoides farinae]|uniref:uncharacterized protein LOC124493623 n=1 Tax=Dermatophagoides farinae TaxID=6954 RepID=UPI003F638157
MMEKLIHFGRNEIDLYRILLEFDSPFIRESHEYLSDRNFGNQLSPFDRQELATLIVLHQKLNRILVDFSTAIDEFTFTIYRFVSSVIKQTFRKDLGIIETLIESKKFCNYNGLLKYNPLFDDIIRIITTKRPHCQTLFELFQVLKDKYMITIELEYDLFYQKIFTWITRGVLNSSLNESFFIQKSSLDSNTSLDLSKVPQQIDPINAIKIYDTGQLVRKIMQMNSKVKFFDADLFWQNYEKRMELYDITILFRYFLADLANMVFSYIMKETSLKEDSMNFIHHLKAFYLHGNELLWTNFLELKSIEDDGIRKAFNLAIYRTFDDYEAETYMHLISIKERIIENNNHRQSLSAHSSNDIGFKITFRLPSLVKIIITDKVWSKYQSIFIFLQKIKFTRWQLIEYWKRQVLMFKRKNHMNNVDKGGQHKSTQWFLLYSLIRFTGIFYTYVKFCIEYRMDQFFTNVKQIADIDNIQRFHMSTLLAIINDLFIKNTFNFNLINRILDLSKQLMITKYDDGHLIDDYNQAIEIFRETMQINKSHSPFNELLMSI